ncbi:DNA-directed RNA polymerase subunit omega [Candidatus Nitrosacidococcus sp. I8]|uniref:DNA-directed RNA polymerase subunit omega n=1 Tax=Candidatus Nitrosacidococcus sp. I8 TaxID=2942908 RepID=UPI002226BEAB|nr:DNA-directed RNA polymerase subunit omega [Candidatus Nitrosacidococcus sp. I8]CAH9019385.1 DNA-directed RNA polymerase subunit omega [Candidatus Nitrosacidococcus sp. I8]
MARLTVEDCIKHVDNRFMLILVAVKRARQLANGAESTISLDGDKPTVVALREIAEGHINTDILNEDSLPNLLERSYEQREHVQGEF